MMAPNSSSRRADHLICECESCQAKLQSLKAWLGTIAPEYEHTYLVIAHPVRV